MTTKCRILLTTIACLMWTPMLSGGVITARLEGDGRDGNPDDLYVDVTVTLNEPGSSTATWLVEIVSPLHPDIKLDAFYFNLDVDASIVGFGNFDPTGWTVDTDQTPAGGGGGTASFNFAASKETQSADNVTNAQSLSFTSTLTDGSIWTVEMFTGAELFSSNDGALGSGQLGAHLQSLVASGDESDSGFALGDYVGTFNPPPNPPAVPEPASVLVWMLGTCLCGAFVWRRRQGSKQVAVA